MENLGRSGGCRQSRADHRHRGLKPRHYLGKARSHWSWIRQYFALCSRFLLKSILGVVLHAAVFWVTHFRGLLVLLGSPGSLLVVLVRILMVYACT